MNKETPLILQLLFSQNLFRAAETQWNYYLERNHRIMGWVGLEKPPRSSHSTPVMGRDISHYPRMLQALALDTSRDGAALAALYKPKNDNPMSKPHRHVIPRPQLPQAVIFLRKGQHTSKLFNEQKGATLKTAPQASPAITARSGQQGNGNKIGIAIKRERKRSFLQRCYITTATRAQA